MSESVLQGCQQFTHMEGTRQKKRQEFSSVYVCSGTPQQNRTAINTYTHQIQLHIWRGTRQKKGGLYICRSTPLPKIAGIDTDISNLALIGWQSQRNPFLVRLRDHCNTLQHTATHSRTSLLDIAVKPTRSNCSTTTRHLATGIEEHPRIS